MTDLNKLLLLFSACMALAVAQRALTREVSVQCYKNSNENTLSMYFLSKLHDDDINWLFGLALNTTSSLYYKDSCTFNKTADGLIFVESTINLNDESSTNPCGFTKIMTTGANPVLHGPQWRIALRKVEKDFLFYLGRDYIFSCNISMATDTWLTTEVQVVDNLKQDLDVVKPAIKFYVIPESTNPNVDPITTCTVGDYLQLEIEMQIISHTEYVMPTGVYVYNTTMNSENDFTSGVRVLTKLNGCVQTVNLVDMVSGFTEKVNLYTGNPAKDLMFKTRSGRFKCRKYNNKNKLYFATNIGMCSGAVHGNTRDQRCVNLCDYNTRKRREVDESFEQLVTSITILDESPNVHQDANGLSTTVLIIVVAMLALAMFGLAIVVAYFCFSRRKRSVYKEKIDSRTSSERSLPVKF